MILLIFSHSKHKYMSPCFAGEIGDVTSKYGCHIILLESVSHIKRKKYKVLEIGVRVVGRKRLFAMAQIYC